MNIDLYDANGLNFVELNITGDNDNYIRCDKESKYIDSEVFNLFSNCFESANKLFDYFEPTKYNARKIIPLRNELIKSRDRLKSAVNLTDFLSFINEQFLGSEFINSLQKADPDWKDNWRDYLKKIIKVNEEIISLTEKCADEERTLWIIGY